ncbi:hypothetical protein [Cohnella faecalis]|uniref:hypothetical protein n=1 Tax=Cohnella faecalis TaxID=2315694 RepID=UPI001F1F28E2|nr:hypothetical protein [Cohnella faecalis]
MLAQGAKCSIGDQLEPSGVLSVPMYKRIGEVYAEVEKKEPWCRNVTAVTDIGVFTPEEFHGADTGNLPEASEGCAACCRRADTNSISSTRRPISRNTGCSSFRTSYRFPMLSHSG